MVNLESGNITLFTGRINLYESPMRTARQELLDEAKLLFRQLQIYVEQCGLLHHQDINIGIEYFFRDLLNRLRGWNLGNANALFGVQQDAFDLSDGARRIAIQVTSTKTAVKIRKTLKSFVKNHRNEYDKLLIIYPFHTLPKSKADFSKASDGFDFDADRHRHSLGSILKELQDADPDELREIVEFLRNELGPLCGYAEPSRDATLEALCDVLRYMADNAPMEQIKDWESTPDLKEKQQRLGEGALYIFQQWESACQLHASIAEAKAAIGYDCPRIAKVQAWLNMRSLDALRENGGDAIAAFKILAKNVLLEAHDSSTPPEETAVRFLLADEFQRCNVFPNPTKRR